MRLAWLSVLLGLGCVSAWRVSAGPTVDTHGHAGAAVRLSFIQGIADDSGEGFAVVETAGVGAHAGQAGALFGLGGEYLSAPAGPALLRAGVELAGQSEGPAVGWGAEVIGLVPVNQRHDRHAARRPGTFDSQTDYVSAIGLDVHATLLAGTGASDGWSGEIFVGPALESSTTWHFYDLR